MFQILQADSHRIPLAANSVQCVVTSPPYWGLRDYGTATWVGGKEGEVDWNYYHPADRPDEWIEPDANHPESWVRKGCDHLGPPMRTNNKPTNNGTFHGGTSRANEPWKNGECGKCGATRIDSQIGLEPTPEEYVKKIVAVFAEVWRVLRDDGTCWVNLGDSYAANGIKQHGGWNGEHDASYGKRPGIRTEQRIKGANLGGECDLAASGLKPKDLVGIPWRVAFALQAAGWYLRSDIIWSKPNPMPESVTDRPTKAHEYIFLLTKRERYFFDQDAVREDSIDPESFNGRNKRFTANIVNHDAGYDGHRTKVGLLKLDGQTYPTRNIRTVWEVATQPYPKSHFATFPEEIAIRCIKAGSKINSVVLDPFSGAGTVPLVADKLNRRGIGLELKSDYCRMAHDRCYDDAPLLAAMEG